MKLETGADRQSNGGGRKLQLMTSLVVVCLCMIDNNKVLGLDPFSFEDIYTTSAVGFSARWIDGTNDYLYRRSGGNLMRFNAATKAETVFINATYFSQLSTTYFLSPDLQYALFAIGYTSIWRHSFNASYKILNVNTGVVTAFPSGTTDDPILQYANWGPDGSLTYVTGNNLYYQRDVSAAPVQLTTTGDLTWVYNGIPDWLYEEDVFGDRIAHYFSPSGRYILYAEFNDTDIPLQPWPWYGPKTNMYPETRTIPYPKPGDVRDGKPGPNSKVKLYVVDTATDLSTRKDIPTVNSLLSEVDYYYTQVVWRDDDTVMVTWANRVQNVSWAALYDVTQAAPQPVVNYQLSVSNGWVQVPPADVRFIDSGARYLTILPNTINATVGSWRDLAVVTSPTTGPGAASFILQREEEVTSVACFDVANSMIYYISTGGDPSERHLFSVPLLGGPRQCLTCDYSDACKYVSASFSSDCVYYVLTCRGPDVPTYVLRDRRDNSADYTLENNDALRTKLAGIAMPTRQFVTFPLNFDNYVGRAEVFFPPDYVPGSGQKYPLLVYTYAGPESQRVMKTYWVGGSTANWLNYMKSTHSVVVVSIDGRGTIANGDKLKFEIYRKLGTVEIQDQITGGKYFAAQDFIDDSLPLAIFGWSYGGFTTAHVIGSSENTFQCGISVAPTTSKAYYDTAYTERFLGLDTPDDNAAGYNATDVMNKVANFKDKSFLVAHGTADDNVHWMHTGQLVRSLSEAGVIFRQNVYLDQDHGIGSYYQNRHLFLTLTDFLLNDCWKGRQQSTPSYTAGASMMTSSFGISLLTSVVTSLLVLRHLA